MDAEPDYDTSNLKALRLDLERLNQAALKSGLIAVRDGWTETQEPAVHKKRAPAGKKKPVARARRGAKAPAKELPTQADALASEVNAKEPAKGMATSAESVDKGKAAATRLLAMLGRVAGDKSPTVLGTEFTEIGVVRLLAHLRRPRSRNSLFLQRLHRLLKRPVAMGIHTSAGVSVEALQLVSRQLLEIETHGWHYLQSRRAARRGRKAPPPQELETPMPRRPAADRASAVKPVTAAKPASAVKAGSKAKAAPKAKASKLK